MCFKPYPSHLIGWSAPLPVAVQDVRRCMRHGGVPQRQGRHGHLLQLLHRRYTISCPAVLRPAMLAVPMPQVPVLFRLSVASSHVRIAIAHISVQALVQNLWACSFCLAAKPSTYCQNVWSSEGRSELTLNLTSLTCRAIPCGDVEL